MPTTPRILLDCRWLNSGGAGRVTELLLRGLALSPPDARWILWGPPSVQALAWRGAEVVLEPHDPRMLNGQRAWFAIPDCELALFMHQQRPQRRVPSVTMIYDTIPLRFASGTLERAVKRRFLQRVATISRHIVTTSEYSKKCIATDLGVSASKVSVAVCPGDPLMAQRVAELRRTLEPQPVALYLGLFLPHKNLEMLIEAFARTAFCAEGGRLRLTGGSRAEHSDLTSRLTEAQRRYVEIRPFGSQSDLETLLATCRFLVQPSLEEGFGLPAWEALCCGVPVCASDGGSLPEVTRGYANQFPARSFDRMVEALDACAYRDQANTPEVAEVASRRFLEQAPSIEEFAARIQGILRTALESPERAA